MDCDGKEMKYYGLPGSYMAFHADLFPLIAPLPPREEIFTSIHFPDSLVALGTEMSPTVRIHTLKT